MDGEHETLNDPGDFFAQVATALGDEAEGLYGAGRGDGSIGLEIPRSGIPVEEMIDVISGAPSASGSTVPTSGRRCPRPRTFHR